jgi:Fe-Mn family superoxide dismutase
MFTLPALPYTYDALEPVVSETTMRTHHDKHHKSYVETLNKLLAESGETPETLEALIGQAAGMGAKLFHNAAQAWNHAFFWECMSPDRTAPSSEFAGLRDKFITEAAEHFASGWCWIADKDGQLIVCTTHDADTLAARSDLTPVLVCDLWEHAYYLDYKNDRKAYLGKWFDGAANWRFAENQLRAARGQGALYRYPRPTMDRNTIGQSPQIRA